MVNTPLYAEPKTNALNVNLQYIKNDGVDISSLHAMLIVMCDCMLGRIPTSKLLRGFTQT